MLRGSPEENTRAAARIAGCKTMALPLVSLIHLLKKAVRCILNGPGEPIIEILVKGTQLGRRS